MTRKQCKAHTGDLFWLEGEKDFPCELPRGHQGWHERTSPPLAATWRDIKGGGREVATATAIT